MRQIAATSRLVCTVAATSRFRLVYRCDMSHKFKPVWICATDRSDKFLSQRQVFVAATMIFTCHTRRFVAATCRGDVSQRFVAFKEAMTVSLDIGVCLPIGWQKNHCKFIQYVTLERMSFALNSMLISSTTFNLYRDKRSKNIEI